MRPHPHPAVSTKRLRFSGNQWRIIALALRLSPRQLAIVKLIFDDRTEAGIAHGLEISPHTVHTHLERLYRKLGVGGRTGVLLCVFGAIHGAEAEAAQQTGGAPVRRV